MKSDQVLADDLLAVIIDINIIKNEIMNKGNKELYLQLNNVNNLISGVRKQLMGK